MDNKINVCLQSHIPLLFEDPVLSANPVNLVELLDKLLFSWSNLYFPNVWWVRHCVVSYNKEAEKTEIWESGVRAALVCFFRRIPSTAASSSLRSLWWCNPSSWLRHNLMKLGQVEFCSARMRLTVLVGQEVFKSVKIFSTKSIYTCR